MTHELLGNHKPSFEWYTPEYIWQSVSTVLGKNIYDPCPIKNRTTTNGLSEKWGETVKRFDFDGIYVNPPTPAAKWAQKAINEIAKNPDLSIIFAAFSESVLWQVNELQDWRICWVRNRIKWVDGNPLKKNRKGELEPNPDHMKQSSKPRNYNCFVLISSDYDKHCLFDEEFSKYGNIRISEIIMEMQK